MEMTVVALAINFAATTAQLDVVGPGPKRRHGIIQMQRVGAMLMVTVALSMLLP